MLKLEYIKKDAQVRGIQTDEIVRIVGNTAFFNRIGQERAFDIAMALR